MVVYVARKVTRHLRSLVWVPINGSHQEGLFIVVTLRTGLPPDFITVPHLTSSRSIPLFSRLRKLKFLQEN